jgi:urease accessory protein
MAMLTSGDRGDIARLRLMQLVSPSLPIGGFTYSQGIEWAVEAGWIHDIQTLEAWISDQMATSLAYLDLAILLRLCAACECRQDDELAVWIDRLLAGRETAELRREERDRGRALADLLVAWEMPGAHAWRPLLARSQAAGFAFAAVSWEITPGAAALGYTWAWLEGLLLAGIKLVPLGQTAGQQGLARLATRIPSALETARSVPDDEIGSAMPALAIASAGHETQYTRLFRS